jgi:hypothetical protein
MDFYNLVLSGWNLPLVTAISVLLFAMEAVVPELFEKGRIGNRLEIPAHLVPAVLCVVFVPGPWMPPDVVVGQKVVLGIIIGALAYVVSGTLKRYGLRGLVDVLRGRLSGGSAEEDKTPVPTDKP